MRKTLYVFLLFSTGLLRPGGWPTLSASILPSLLKLWVPRPRVFCEGGYDADCAMRFRRIQNPKLSAASYPPFAQNAKSGAPTLMAVSSISKAGPPRPFRSIGSSRVAHPLRGLQRVGIRAADCVEKRKSNSLGTDRLLTPPFRKKRERMGHPAVGRCRKDPVGKP